jgi:hypothetical protein
LAPGYAVDRNTKVASRFKSGGRAPHNRQNRHLKGAVALELLLASERSITMETWARQVFHDREFRQFIPMVQRR